MENTNDDNEEDDSGGSDDDRPTLQVCCQDWTGRCLFVCLFDLFFFSLYNTVLVLPYIVL